jgi:hypothetical protein
MALFAIIRLLFPDPKVRNRVLAGVLVLVVGAAVLYATLNPIFAIVCGFAFGIVVAIGFWVQKRLVTHAELQGMKPLDLSKAAGVIFVIATIGGTAAWMATYK